MDVSELLIERKMERIEGWLLDLAADNEELRQRFRENRLDVYGHMNALGRDMDRVIDRVNELADKTKRGFKRAREELDSQSEHLLDVERRIVAFEAAAESLKKRIGELETDFSAHEHRDQDVDDKLRGIGNDIQAHKTRLNTHAGRLNNHRDRILTLEGKAKKARTTE